MKIVHKVLVGSQLHGLANKNSDFDYRGVHINKISDMLSPFKKIKNTSWIEGDEDNTSYELTDFCKAATQGNPTILEVLYSNEIIETSDIGIKLYENREKFLDSKRIWEACRGYAHNQYKKMNLFEPDARTPKFCVAYIRTLHQGEQLLRTGEMSPQIDSSIKDELLEIKYNFKNYPKSKLTKLFEDKMQKLNEAYCDNNNKFTPNIKWIEDFILRSYINDEQ